MAASARLVCLLEEGHGVFPKPDHLEMFVIVWVGAIHLLLVANLFLFLKLLVGEEGFA